MTSEEKAACEALDPFVRLIVMDGRTEDAVRLSTAVCKGAINSFLAQPSDEGARLLCEALQSMTFSHGIFWRARTRTQRYSALMRVALYYAGFPYMPDAEAAKEELA